jgi:nicotinamidase-related amidase
MGRPISGRVALISEGLSTYINFLDRYGQKYNPGSPSGLQVKPPHTTMDLISDPADLASPLAYNASQTAILLMDFQNFIIQQCGKVGEDALGRAKTMRDWAIKHNILVIHSVVDVTGKPPPTCKGVARLNKMLEGVTQDRTAAEEPEEIAFSQSKNEYVVLKSPGHVSALKSKGAMELLEERGIRSLILCGLATSGAVLRTAVSASDDDFVVTIIEDACADPRDGLHETLMKSVLPSRAHVGKASDFVELWKT